MEKYSAIETFLKYMGSGLILIWFLLALIWLFFHEKRKPRRILFVYTPVIALVLFFNPWFSGLICRLLGGEVYFRTCWVLPVILEISYCAVEIAGKWKGRKGASFAAVSFLLILVSGRLVYSNPLYSLAENRYHMPDSVVHICDAIRVPGREVMAVFPEEMLLYVRQYSPYVCMAYGREVLMGVSDELYEFIELADVVDMEAVVPMTRAAGCHYIILRTEKKLSKTAEAYGWTVFLETDGYTVYRDEAVELAVPVH